MTKELLGKWLVGLEGEALNSQDIRADVSPKLGQELTSTERKCYGIIVSSGQQRLSAESLYQILYGFADSPERMSNAIAVLIGRIRAKLGETAIITSRGDGYTARNVVRRTTLPVMSAPPVNTNETLTQPFRYLV